MKKGILIFSVVLIVILTGLVSSIENVTITGKAVTGKATDAILGMRVTITVGSPTIQIISPKNETYFSISNLLLNYSGINVGSVWYNLDNNPNQTISSYVLINASVGNHILFLYANNSDGGMNSTNLTFSINVTKLTILYSEFVGLDKGESINFNQTSYEDIQNLNEVILEKTLGKIKFNEKINLTADENSSDNLIDLDTNINISLNRIYINSTALPNFNKSATLYLYGLSFTNPQILKDGAICSVSICVKESYSGGTLKFNVTGFSVYSSQETQTGTTTPPSTSGGGGGSSIQVLTRTPSFETNQEIIKVSSTPGRVITKNLMITNILNKSITLILSQKNIQDFLTIKETQITLKPQESKEISFDFIINAKTAPNLYTGKIIITDQNYYSYEIMVLLEIESEGALLDVSTKILPEFSIINSGKEILYEINLFNVGTIIGKRDIILEHTIKSAEGKIIVQYNETVSIETQTNLIRRFKVPSTTSSGKYILSVKAITDEGKIAIGSDTFEVINPLTKFFIIGFILICIILIILALKVYSKKKRKRLRKKK